MKRVIINNVKPVHNMANRAFAAKTKLQWNDPLLWSDELSED